jgi:hypothetical protein
LVHFHWTAWCYEVVSKSSRTYCCNSLGDRTNSATKHWFTFIGLHGVTKLYRKVPGLIVVTVSVIEETQLRNIGSLSSNCMVLRSGIEKFPDLL